MESYAVITVGGKQYRVREGQRLLVDRLGVDEGKTFHPDILMLGGDGEPKLGDGLKGQQVTARVAGHVLGEKVVVGKHRRRTGYRRRNGFRARLTQIEIQTIGKKATRSTTPKKETAAKKPAVKKPDVKKPAAKKPAARKPAGMKSTTRKKSEEKA